MTVAALMVAAATTAVVTKVGPGGYPRGVEFLGERMVCSGMDVFKDDAGGSRWSHVGTVLSSDGAAGVDISNCVLYYDTNTTTLLASYRHHTGCKTTPVDVVALDDSPVDDVALDAPSDAKQQHAFHSHNHHPTNGSVTLCSSYTIQVSASHDLGRTWDQLSTVVNSTVGVW
jgi:hypothetical protein